MPEQHGDEFDVLYQSIGRRIVYARKARHRTQTQLATATLLGRSSIANIEAGRQRPSIHNLMLIAASLEIGVAELLGLDGGPGSGMLPVLDGALVDQLRRGAHAQGWNDCARAMRTATNAVQYPGATDG